MIKQRGEFGASPRVRRLPLERVARRSFIGQRRLRGVRVSAKRFQGLAQFARLRAGQVGRIIGPDESKFVQRPTQSGAVQSKTRRFESPANRRQTRGITPRQFAETAHAKQHIFQRIAGKFFRRGAFPRGFSTKPAKVFRQTPIALGLAARAGFAPRLAAGKHEQRARVRRR